MHGEVPILALYVPGWQLRHCPEIVSFPAGQLTVAPMHCDDDVEPAGEVVPAGHAVHCDGHRFKHSLQHLEHTPSSLQNSLILGLCDTAYMAHIV